MKLYYVIHTKGDDEFTVAKMDDKENAVKAAREFWSTLTTGDRKKSIVEVRDYIEDVEDEDCTCFDYDTIPWQIWTACRETGALIEQCDNYVQAERLIDEYEETDKLDDEYEPDFYEIVNERHERIRKTSEAQLRAGAKYDEANTRQFAIKLNLKTDAKLIEALDRSPNKQALIKQALTEYLEK